MNTARIAGIQNEKKGIMIMTNLAPEKKTKRVCPYCHHDKFRDLGFDNYQCLQCAEVLDINEPVNISSVK